MNFLIQHALDYHAQHSPKNTAVTCLDQNLSYSQLHAKANQLAHTLIDLGIKPNDRVGIYMNKCLDVSIAIYGILKAGGAYVPIDPNAPVNRVASIIDDCGITVLISHNAKAKRLVKVIQNTSQISHIVGIDASILGESINQHKAQVIPWQSVFDGNNKTSPKVDLIESDLAYIIYTSGSTGKPKGIMHTHHSCLSYVHWAIQTVDVSANDRLGNHCPLHFDISIFDWFAAVVSGACVIVIPDEYTKLPASYAQLIAQSRMTVLFTVPFALIQLVQYGELDKHDLSKLRWITFAGEPMVVKHLHTIMQTLPHVTFDNMFGPAETNVCTHYKIESIDPTATAIPIGVMCDVSQSRIVDEQNNSVDNGETGELLVRTPTMMQGYWASPSLNEKAFYVHQDETSLSKRYYRTGDLVKLDEQGLMWFVGRKDRQVKVRGYRVELDEIEAILVSHSCVEEAAVYHLSLQDAPTTLHACYTCKVDVNAVESSNENDILKFLKTKLPSYALPSSLTKVKAFPRTSSDKIDRNKIIKEAAHVS